LKLKLKFKPAMTRVSKEKTKEYQLPGALDATAGANIGSSSWFAGLPALLALPVDGPTP
jgi:hypothetical protein